MTRVAILITSAGQRQLADLARAAIAKFTTEPHDVFLIDHGAWQELGSDANAKALTLLRGAVTRDYSHVFIMHDDALPIADGWLSLLLSKPLPAAAMVSQRSQRGHSAGTLFDAATFRTMKLTPSLPEYDVAESVPLGWGADRHDHRGGCACREWWSLSECDVALADGTPFYLHLGGGTIGAGSMRPDSWEHRTRLTAWVQAATGGLGL